MTEQRRQPSMEEILTSIRRIISQDSVQRRDPSFGRGAAAPEDGGLPPERPSAEVLLLTEVVGDGGAARLDPLEAPSVARREPVFQRALDEAGARRPAEAAPLPGPSLISEERAAASAALLRELVRNVTQANEMSLGSDPTLEALVREALPPLLSDWLDARLPPLIERLVREEIRRIVARAEQGL